MFLLNQNKHQCNFIWIKIILPEESEIYEIMFSFNAISYLFNAINSNPLKCEDLKKLINLNIRSEINCQNENDSHSNNIKHFLLIILKLLIQNHCISILSISEIQKFWTQIITQSCSNYWLQLFLLLPELYGSVKILEG